MSLNELEERLRAYSVTNIGEIEFAILETNGQLSVILKPEKRAFSGIVGREKVSISDMSKRIEEKLEKFKKISFISAFDGAKSKPELVAIFLAILELISGGRIAADYSDKDRDFILKKNTRGKK